MWRCRFDLRCWGVPLNVAGHSRQCAISEFGIGNVGEVGDIELCDIAVGEVSELARVSPDKLIVESSDVRLVGEELVLLPALCELVWGYDLSSVRSGRIIATTLVSGQRLVEALTLWYLSRSSDTARISCRSAM